MRFLMYSQKVRRPHAFLPCAVLALTWILALDAAWAGPSQHKFMGAASCSASNCHGAASPRDSSNVLQNEYTTWSKHDRHAQAWLSLTGDSAKTIAKHLGLSSPEKEPWCLRCHSTYVESESLRHSQFRTEDGVSCESCHGAAEGYLKEHYQARTTHSQNLNLGLRDIVPLSNRANLCLSCHYGSNEAVVNHRLIGAGHPRLSFELDTFSMLQPKHWVVDSDYEARKAVYSSARAWLVGQVSIAQTALKALQSPKWSRAGAFPELSLLSCYSCHHSLSQKQWKSRDYEGRPGQLRLNTSSLFVVKESLEALHSPLASPVEAGLKNLHESFYETGAPGDVGALEKSLTQSRDYFESTALDSASLHALLRSTVKAGAQSAQLQYESAEQIAMALSSILAELSPANGMYSVELKAVYASLASPEEFVAENFTKACQQFEKTLQSKK